MRGKFVSFFLSINAFVYFTKERECWNMLKDIVPEISIVYVRNNECFANKAAANVDDG